MKEMYISKVGYNLTEDDSLIPRKPSEDLEVLLNASEQTISSLFELTKDVDYVKAVDVECRIKGLKNIVAVLEFNLSRIGVS